MVKNKHYWKVKAAMLERQNVEAEARAVMAAALAKMRATMTAAGLDPDKQYILSDEGETITLAPKP